MERRKKPTVLKLLTFPPDFFAIPIKNKICLFFCPIWVFLQFKNIYISLHLLNYFDPTPFQDKSTRRMCFLHFS